MNSNFETRKTKLFQHLLSEDFERELLDFVENMHSEGQSYESIYELFLGFHKEIQIDSRTKNNESIYNRLSDFMDAFTDWGKTLKFQDKK